MLTGKGSSLTWYRKIDSKERAELVLCQLLVCVQHVPRHSTAVLLLFYDQQCQSWVKNSVPKPTKNIQLINSISDR